MIARRHFSLPALLFLALAAWLGLAGRAHGQVIDRIDIAPRDGEAEIRITFTTQIQYQRHAPQSQGELLRIFLQRTSLAMAPEPTKETLPSPKSDLVARFTVTFPELDNALLIKFARSTAFKVRPGPDGRSIIVTVPSAVPKRPEPVPTPPLPGPEAPPAGALPAPVALTQKEIEDRALALSQDGRKALEANDPATAVEKLNQLLNLPPNSQSELAQALVGEAREANGEVAKARAEYELYLKLFPQGAAAAKIRDRLAKMAAEPAVVVRPGEPPAAPTQWTIFGSLSQNYYSGQSHIDTQNTPPGERPTFRTLDIADQRALVSNLDFNARRRDEVTDTRVVFRDTHTANFLPGQKDVNRFNAAYVEQTHKDLGYLLRAGRQTGNAGGVLGRFDGLWAGYNLSPKWRANVTVGSPVEFNSPYSKRFYGASLDLLAQPENWGGSIYAIQQTTEDVIDRRAVGAEARYFDSYRTFFGMLDYDTTFNAINIAMFQGNWQLETGTNLFAIFDHRKTPPLGITNAMIGDAVNPFATALRTNGESEMRLRAQALTAESNLFMAGFTHPVTQRWQAGADFRVSNITGTEAVGAVPASPGSGNVFTYTAQVIGNGLYFENDVAVINASHIQAPTLDANTIGISYVTLLYERWRVEGSFRYYGQKDDQGARLTRLAPVLRLTYRWRDNLSFEAEAGIEDSKTNGPAVIEAGRRRYVYLGYRWDF